jgi:hypothetical protein
VIPAAAGAPVRWWDVDAEVPDEAKQVGPLEAQGASGGGAIAGSGPELTGEKLPLERGDSLAVRGCPHDGSPVTHATCRNADLSDDWDGGFGGRYAGVAPEDRGVTSQRPPNATARQVARVVSPRPRQATSQADVDRHAAA